jgi:hypothetical protein
VFGETATQAWFSTESEYTGLLAVLQERSLPSHLWTGYNDLQAGGAWTYGLHALPSFASWAAGEPSEGHCVELTSAVGADNTSYVLSAASCTTPKSVLCRHGGGFAPIVVGSGTEEVVFELIPSLLTFAEAEALCTEFDQQLAWFDTLEQYNAVVAALTSDNVITPGGGGLEQSVWVGYADHGDLVSHWVPIAYPDRTLPGFINIGNSFLNDGDCSLMAMPVNTTRVAIDQYDCNQVSRVLCRHRAWPYRPGTSCFARRLPDTTRRLF